MVTAALLESSLVINLDRRPDRWNRFRQRAADAGFSPQRFAAIDARASDIQLVTKDAQKAAELACWRSHLETWRRAADANLPAAVVFEDDAVFDVAFREKFNSYLRQVPGSWQIVLFGPSYLQPPRPIAENVLRTTCSYTLHGYMIRGGAFLMTLISEAEQAWNAVAGDLRGGGSPKSAIDEWLGDRYGQIEAYSFTPALVWQDADFSDIRHVAVNYDRYLKRGHAAPSVPTYDFSADWFTPHIPAWKRLFAGLRWPSQHHPLRVLEVGSFEGRSTCWLLENLLTHPQSRIVAVDSFEGVIGLTEGTKSSVKERFLRNIKATGAAEKVDLAEGQSGDVLRRFRPTPSFDLIYIDGNHDARRVLEDAILCWPLLKIGGALIFDDYLFGSPENAVSNPKFAIDAFLHIHSCELTVLQGFPLWQIYLQKRLPLHATNRL
jgi:GR25 family glycosyltransferase involved in LPS biosynthesis/predicted O-methyltransferase YrrM